LKAKKQFPPVAKLAPVPLNDPFQNCVATDCEKSAIRSVAGNPLCERHAKQMERQPSREAKPAPKFDPNDLLADLVQYQRDANEYEYLAVRGTSGLAKLARKFGYKVNKSDSHNRNALIDMIVNRADPDYLKTWATTKTRKNLASQAESNGRVVLNLWITETTQDMRAKIRERGVKP
jgi:hypothetical protein